MVVVFYHTSKIVFFGKCAVYVFFILSGYWLDQIYRSKYSQTLNPIRTFYVSRFLRIYPVFAASTVLGFLAQWLIQSPIEIGWKQWIPLGYSSLPYRLLEPGWSLDIEVQFYIIFPLLFSIFLQGVRALSGLAVLLLLLGSTYYFGLLNSFLTYSGFFVAGMAVSHYKWKPSETLFRTSVVASVALFAVVFAVSATRNSILGSGKVSFQGNDLTLVFDIMLAVLMVPFVAKNVMVRDTSLGRHAGNLSFPLYLVHWVTLGPYVAWYGGLPVRERLVWFGMYLLVTAVITLLVYITVDRPFENARRKYINSRCHKSISTETPTLIGESVSQ